jgi:uncharacterized protein YdbL (DUF1318 family)
MMRFAPVLALSLLCCCSSLAQNTELKDVSTQGLVGEYDRRFFAIVGELESAMQQFATDALSAGQRFAMPRALTDAEVTAIDRVISSAAPYVEVKDIRAMALVAGAYEFRFKHRPDLGAYNCQMLKLTFEAAGNGGVHVASIVSNLYAAGNHVPKNDILAYYWSLEAKRHDPNASIEKSNWLRNLPEVEVDKLNKDWINWSPARAAAKESEKLKCS